MDGHWIMAHWMFCSFIQIVLHLVKKGNLKLGKSILEAVDSNSNGNPYTNAVCFNLNECDFPLLPFPATRCKPFAYQQNMWVLFINQSVMCLNQLFKNMNLSVKLFYLFLLYPTQCPTVHCVNLLLFLCLMTFLLGFQLLPFPLTYQTIAILMLQFNLLL